METPICDFVRAYAARDPVRMHMPGHKGTGPLGVEALDITEIDGADVLYRQHGIIWQSEQNAARLFGAAKTLYSTEGASLCIRAMLYLDALYARRRGRRPCLLAGRNAHKTLITAAALLDIDIDWIYPDDNFGMLSCGAAPALVDEKLRQKKYSGVYVTSPDYLGNLSQIKPLAAVCHLHDVPLLVDNAHGAYLRFLQEDLHPISLGADLCCDSAHKTLPCLTGAAYLHVGRNAPPGFFREAEQAMAMFASTSPSYLILQSLDYANRLLAEEYPERLTHCVERVGALRERLRDHGYLITGGEPMKLTLCTRHYGYPGYAIALALRDRGITCEYYDAAYVVLMPSPMTPDQDLDKLEQALRSRIRLRPILADPHPPLPHPERVCSIREAMMSPRRELSGRDLLGHVVCDAPVPCPPGVPIVVPGERIDEAALACMQYYGAVQCQVMRGD